MNTRKTLKRFVALLAALVIVVMTNMAISSALSSEGSGVSDEYSAVVGHIAKPPLPPPDAN